MVTSAKKCKAKYCTDCKVELKEIDKVRQAEKRQEAKKRKIQEKELTEKFPKEEISPKKLNVVSEEKLTPLMHGSDKIMVVMPSLALLSQIVGLRFMFHKDMDSIHRDSSWSKVEDCLIRGTRNTTSKKYLASYLPFGWQSTNWKQDMRQWANPHQLCVVETLLNEIKDLLTNKAKMHHTTVTLFATENKKVAVPHKIKDVLQQTDEDIGWNFCLPLCREGAHLFL